MKALIFVLPSYAMGFLVALPAGPIQIEIIRRSINSHQRSSIMVILGAMAVNAVYGPDLWQGIELPS